MRWHSWSIDCRRASARKRASASAARAQHRGAPWPSGGEQPVLATVSIDGELALSAQLPHDVGCGDTCDLHLVVHAPARSGTLALAINFVHHRMGYFRDSGVADLELEVRSDGEAMADAALFEIAGRATGPSTILRRRLAAGRWHRAAAIPRAGARAHVWDSSGRRYIDYTIGWGCALLGHGNDIVESARCAAACAPARHCRCRTVWRWS
jgi:hypothetical protein